MTSSPHRDDRAPRRPARRAAPRRSTAPRRCSPTSSRPTTRSPSPRPTEALGPGPVDHLAAARGAGAHPAAGALRAPGSTSAARCSCSTPPATTATRSSPGWRCPMLEAIGESTGETVHLAVANGGRVAHIAQVDSTFLLGARDWTDIEIPPHCSALGKVLLAWDVLDRARRPARDAHRAHPAQPRRPRRRPRAGPQPRLRRHPRRARGRPRRRRRTGVRTGRSDVVAAVGVSGPTARLEDRLDQLGRLLIEQTEALSELLRHGTQTQAGPRKGHGMTPDEILKGLYDETLVGNAPRVLELTHEALEHGHGAAEPAVRRADPLARGGRRPVRAR